MADLKAAAPDVLILASHIPDGIAFRQAMLAAGLKVGALIGSTMAECDPDFAGELGAAAIGIFASDRPTAGFQPTALGRRCGRRVCAIRCCLGEGRRPGPGEHRRLPRTYGDEGIHDPRARRRRDRRGTEEALAGFTAGWALFHHVCPAAAAFDSGAVAGRRARHRPARRRAAERRRPAGSRRTRSRLGQNDRAAAVIWQWQAVRTYEFVWPPTYATGAVAFVPLAR